MTLKRASRAGPNAVEMAIDLVDHNDVDLAGTDIFQKPLEGRSFG
jgi:hypothetical protein